MLAGCFRSIPIGQPVRPSVSLPPGELFDGQIVWWTFVKSHAHHLHSLLVRVMGQFVSLLATSSNGREGRHLTKVSHSINHARRRQLNCSPTVTQVSIYQLSEPRTEGGSLFFV